MQKNVILWILAFSITIATAVYRRVTGPSYPISGSVHLTDNKTLIAMIGWMIAILMYRRNNGPKRWALYASIL